jgi:hypothetical protein
MKCKQPSNPWEDPEDVFYGHAEPRLNPLFLGFLGLVAWVTIFLLVSTLFQLATLFY